MAGTLTKMGIGVGIFIMVFTVFMATMISLGNEYGSSIESTYSYSNYQGEYQNVSNDYQDLSAGAAIDQQNSDTAQYQERISSENQKVSYASVFTLAMNDLAKIFPVNPIIWKVLGSILLLIVFAGYVYLFWGRVL